MPKLKCTQVTPKLDILFFVVNHVFDLLTLYLQGYIIIRIFSFLIEIYVMEDA